MRFHLPVLTLSLLLLAAPVHAEDPLATAEAVTDETVRIVATLDEGLLGKHLPYCDPRDAEEGQSLVGHVIKGCFQVLQVEEEVGPLCAAASVGIAPYRLPDTGAVGAKPHHACIKATANWLVGLAVGTVGQVVEKLPVHISTG